MKRLRPIDLGLGAAILCLAIALKHHYSVAGPDALGWILGPTARAVELVTGTPFEREAGTGYLSREDRFVIAKSCAGVNFLIVAFTASALGFLRSRPTVRGKLLLILGCAAGAYVAALVANTVRIAIALELHLNLTPWGVFTRERLHRLEGTVIYLMFLCGFYLVTRRLAGAAREPSS